MYSSKLSSRFRTVAGRSSRNSVDPASATNSHISPEVSGVVRLSDPHHIASIYIYQTARNDQHTRPAIHVAGVEF